VSLQRKYLFEIFGSLLQHSTSLEGIETVAGRRTQTLRAPKTTKVKFCTYQC